jgi:putative membrane protein
MVRWTATTLAALGVGAVVAFLIVGLVPMEMSHDPLTLFLSGMVAITAMILPGISGSFILLILGQYSFVIEAVKELNIIALLPLAAGCVVGIMGFSRILSWLLKHYGQITVAALVGFMVGSLRKIWPWKETVEWMRDRHNELVPKVQVNILPDVTSGEFWIAIGLAVVGFVLVCMIDHWQSQSNPILRLVGIGRPRAHQHDVAAADSPPG